MFPFAKSKALLPWIALLAFLFGLLAPTISHALSASPGQTNVAEICSSTGTKFVADPSADKDQPLSHSILKAFNHCDYCGTHAGSFALLPPSNVVIGLASGPDSFPPLFYHSPKPLFAWTLARSRAPPTSI